MTPQIECVSCKHKIDAEAKLCPYCGADPRTGERFDPRPLLEKHFPRREVMTRTESVLEFFRQRQAIVVTTVIAILFLGVVFLHRFITARNVAQASDVPAIPLTEVADLANRSSETEPVAIPDVDFQYAGSGQRFRSLLVEPGAVPPPTPPDLTAPSPVLARFISPRVRATRPPMSARVESATDATATTTAPTTTQLDIRWSQPSTTQPQDTAAPQAPPTPPEPEPPAEPIETPTDTSPPQ